MLIDKNKKSIHLEKFMKFPKSFENEELNKKWIELKKIRDICNISIEEKRAKKEIGSSLEANLIINVNEELFKITDNIDLAELCITSSVDIVKVKTKIISVQTIKAVGEKCTVCWKINKNRCERHSV